MSQQSFVNWIRQPASIILIIVLAIMFLMVTDQSQQQKGLSSGLADNTSTVVPPMGSPGLGLNLPSELKGKPRIMGGELPKIVRRLGSPAPGVASSGAAGSAPGRLTAPDLGSLLGRLEDKVKAEPNNISNRLLLAQTYNELGLVDKALEEVRAAVKQFSDNSRAKLVLASILSKRKNEVELKEAIVVLKELRGDKGTKQYLVEMYLGDAWIRMGDHQLAMNSWKAALEKMPVSDNRRAKLEKGIADISGENKGT